jgi:4-hydroxybenzoate polyprenyltransferase
MHCRREVLGPQAGATRSARGLRLLPGQPALLALAGFIAHLTPAFYAFLAAMRVHLVWHVAPVHIDDPAGALRLFKSNRWAG